MSFIRFWVGFSIIGISCAIMLLLWALKRRQFKESDRAGHLALSDITLADETTSTPAEGFSRDSIALLGVLGVGFLVMIVSIVVAFIATGEE